MSSKNQPEQLDALRQTSFWAVSIFEFRFGLSAPDCFAVI
jgi:hypothetical protein